MNAAIEDALIDLLVRRMADLVAPNKCCSWHAMGGRCQRAPKSALQDERGSTHRRDAARIDLPRFRRRDERHLERSEARAS